MFASQWRFALPTLAGLCFGLVCTILLVYWLLMRFTSAFYWSHYCQSILSHLRRIGRCESRRSHEETPLEAILTGFFFVCYPHFTHQFSHNVQLRPKMWVKSGLVSSASGIPSPLLFPQFDGWPVALVDGLLQPVARNDRIAGYLSFVFQLNPT